MCLSLNLCLYRLVKQIEFLAAHRQIFKALYVLSRCIFRIIASNKPLYQLTLSRCLANMKQTFTTQKGCIYIFGFWFWFVKGNVKGNVHSRISFSSLCLLFMHHKSSSVFRNQLFRCECDIGWEGFLCHQEIDYCKEKPCQNNGTCFNEVQYQQGVLMFKIFCLLVSKINQSTEF